MPAGYYTAASPAKKKRKSSKWAGAKSPALKNYGFGVSDAISSMTKSALTGMAAPIKESETFKGTRSRITGIASPMGELLNMTKRKGKYPPPKKKKVAGKKSPKVRAHTLHERAKDARRGRLSY